MDHSSNRNHHATTHDHANTPSREQRLRRLKRLTSFLSGLKYMGISFLLGCCALPLGAYPLGAAFVCAATTQVPYVFAGLLLSGLLPTAPLPFWTHLLICVSILGLRLLFLFTADRPHATQGRKVPPRPTKSAHDFLSTMQDVLWGTPHDDTMTDYYCGRNNTPATRETYQKEAGTPQDPDTSPVTIPLFGESMIYRLLTSSLCGFGMGLCLMIVGGFAVYDLLSALLMTIACPLLTYLLSPCFSESGQALLTVGEPHDSLPRSGHTYLLHHYSGMTLISALLLLFFVTLSAKAFDMVLLPPYITLHLSPILAMLLSLRTTAKHGMIPGVAVAIVTGLGADPLLSPAFILGAVTYGLLRFISHRTGVICGSLAGLLWVLLGGGPTLLVTYLPDMILVTPLCLAWDKLAQQFPTQNPNVAELSVHDFSTSVEQKTRAEAHIDRLEALSGAFSSLSKLFYDLSGQLRHPKLPELRRMCDEVFDRHCDHCRLRDTCDHAEHQHPADILSPAMAVQLYNKGKTEQDSLPREAVTRCIHVKQIIEDVNSRGARMAEQLLRSEKTEVFATD